MSRTSQRSRSVTKTTLSDLLPPTNTDTATEREKLSPVQMPQLPACYNALTCRACHWQLLITSCRGESLWSTTHTNESTVLHTHTHTRSQTSLIKCAYACYTHTHAQVCIWLPHVRGSRGGKKNNHLKALIRIWTVTRLVHKLGEI